MALGFWGRGPESPAFFCEHSIYKLYIFRHRILVRAPSLQKRGPTFRALVYVLVIISNKVTKACSGSTPFFGDEISGLSPSCKTVWQGWQIQPPQSHYTHGQWPNINYSLYTLHVQFPMFCQLENFIRVICVFTTFRFFFDLCQITKSLSHDH